VPFARQEGKFGSLEQNVVDIETSTPQNLEEIIVLPSIKDQMVIKWFGGGMLQWCCNVVIVDLW
jgi:hypothetical protein